MNRNNTNISGKVVVITGASSGLGEAFALVTDVTGAAQVQALVDAAIEKYGRVDVILNNAGVMPHSPLERRKVDDRDRTVDINIKGLLYGIAAALPHMQRQKSGHFINVSSVAGHKVGPASAVYAATKIAVRVISEGLRQEVKPWNLRTTIISPGAVATELPNSRGTTSPDDGRLSHACLRNLYTHFGQGADCRGRSLVVSSLLRKRFESIRELRTGRTAVRNLREQ